MKLKVVVVVDVVEEVKNLSFELDKEFVKNWY